jgi:hypothetical protein
MSGLISEIGMRDRLGVQDHVSIQIIRGNPEIFYVTRPITIDLKIPKDSSVPYTRYDEHVTFFVTAHSQQEAEQLVNEML